MFDDIRFIRKEGQNVIVEVLVNDYEIEEEHYYRTSHPVPHPQPQPREEDIVYVVAKRKPKAGKKLAHGKTPIKASPRMEHETVLVRVPSSVARAATFVR